MMTRVEKMIIVVWQKTPKQLQQIEARVRRALGQDGTLYTSQDDVYY